MRRWVLLTAAMLLCAVASGSSRLTHTASAAGRDVPVQTPTEPAPVGPSAEADRLVEQMTPAEQASSIVMGHIPTADPAKLADYMGTTDLGGFILMGANVPNSEAELRAVTAALASSADVPPLIAIDQEGGDVSRLPWDDFASSIALKERPVAQTAAAFAARASLVARAGANVNFGVIADTTGDASSFIYRRSLGADPASAAERVARASPPGGARSLQPLEAQP